MTVRPALAPAVYLAAKNKIYAGQSGGAVARILAEIGFIRPPVIARMTDQAQFPAETLRAMDADVMVSVFYSDRGVTPADHLAIEGDFAASYAALGRITTMRLFILSQPGLQWMSA